jgi:hypothetical protein
MMQFLGCYRMSFGRDWYVLLTGDWDNALTWQQVHEYDYGNAAWIRFLPP